MKTIALTRNLVAIVDDEDYEYLNQWKWRAMKQRNYFYAQRKSVVNGKHTFIIMHRLILNVPHGLLTDHINHDTLDNRKENLRVCTKQQNGQNRVKQQKESISKYKGVSRYRNQHYIEGKFKSWMAQIVINQKNYYLGSFDTEVEAAIAYNKSATECFGEFAKLNIIKE
jgi:hypothetical protein